MTSKLIRSVLSQAVRNAYPQQEDLAEDDEENPSTDVSPLAIKESLGEN